MTGRIVDCSRQAVLAGLRVGMPLAEALAIIDAHAVGPHSTNTQTTTCVSGGVSGKTTPDQPGTPARLKEPLVLEAYDPEADKLVLRRLADWCDRFNPFVSLDDREGDRPESTGREPDSLLFDLTGCQRLHGSEQKLAQRLVTALAKQGWTIRVAVADTPAAAWAVAHSTDWPKLMAQSSSGWPIRIIPSGQLAWAVDPLPIAVLRLSPAILAQLKELGIDTVDQIRNLDRDGLSSRFGPALLWSLDELLGRVPEILQPQRPAEPITAGWQFEHPVESSEVLSQVLGHLCKQLCDRLRPKQRGITRLNCRLQLDSAGPLLATVALLRPTLDEDHLLQLLHLQLERKTWSSPIVAIRLTVIGLRQLRPEQIDLFNYNRQVEVAALERLIDRMASRLGRDAIVQPQLRADAQPEHAYELNPAELNPAELNPAFSGFDQPAKPIGRQRTSKKKPSQQQESRQARMLAPHRPLRLAAKPIPLLHADGSVAPPTYFRCGGDAFQTQAWWGPERIETGWWRGGAGERDYFRLQTACGQQLWIFRLLTDGSWFLHGWFD